MSKITAALAALTVAAAVLAGCTASARPSTEAEPSSIEPSIDGSPTGLPQRDRCDPDQGLYAGGAGVSNSGVLQPQAFLNVRDLGSRAGASGTVTMNAEGRPASYTVAPHDNPAAVAERFCMQTQELAALNVVRRTSEVIYRGDTLNLDPCTVRTVGDDRGKVYDNDPGVYIPTC